MKNILSLLLFAPLSTFSVATTENSTVTEQCNSMTCQWITTGDSFIPTEEIFEQYPYGHKCNCQKDLGMESKIYECEKQFDAGFSMQNHGENKKIIGNSWVCDIKYALREDTSNTIDNLASTYSSDAPTETEQCNSLLCQWITTGIRPLAKVGYDNYPLGHKCNCQEESKIYECEKQLDAGRLMENRGENKKIIGNTWVCDIKSSLTEDTSTTTDTLASTNSSDAPTETEQCNSFTCQWITTGMRPLAKVGYDNYPLGHKCNCRIRQSKQSVAYTSFYEVLYECVKHPYAIFLPEKYGEYKVIGKTWICKVQVSILR